MTKKDQLIFDSAEEVKVRRDGEERMVDSEFRCGESKTGFERGLRENRGLNLILYLTLQLHGPLWEMQTNDINLIL